MPLEEQSIDEDSLFVWRHHKAVGPGVDFPNSSHNRGIKYCPFCASKLSVKERSQGWEDSWEHNCLRCGFNAYWKEEFGFGSRDRVSISYLKNLSINDESTAIAEVGAHIRRHFSSVASLNPRRFEVLVADVFKQLGYSVLITQQTRDGGYDLVVAESSSGEQAIVECKRYTSGKVGVGVVRELAGVQLIHEEKSAILVATTGFTAPAVEAASAVNLGQSGYKLDLVDAGRLVEMLGVYNPNLPPLELSVSRICES